MNSIGTFPPRISLFFKIPRKNIWWKLFQTFMKIWFDIYFSLIEFEKWFWKYQLDWDEKIRMNNCFGHTLRNLPRRFWEYTFLSSNQKQDKTIIFAFGNVKIFLFELRRWHWDIFQNKFDTLIYFIYIRNHSGNTAFIIFWKYFTDSSQANIDFCLTWNHKNSQNKYHQLPKMSR